MRSYASAVARFACILLLTSVAALAQWTPLNPVVSFEKQTDGVQFKQQTGTLKVQVCSPSVIRVLFSATDSIPQEPQYVIIKKDWAPTQWQMASTDKDVTITTPALKITITKADGAITYRDSNGQQLVQEASRKLMPVTVNGEKTHHAESFVNIYGSREGLYGLGQHQAGVWNYRGESVDISQDNTNISIPLMLSTNGYGIYWNNNSRSRFNNRFANYLYISSEVADVVDYYFLYGPDFDKIIAEYRDMTGQAPMFGRWAYGFWQCKNRYSSQQQLLSIAKEYRDKHIPVDNIVQDWFWWNRKGEMTFNSNYPDPKGMIQQLHDQHFHLMISVWPFFEPGSKEYDYMDKQGWFIDKFKMPKLPYHQNGMAVYDPSNPEARKYYWNLLDQGLFKIGADAWWMDTTEPETEGQEDNIQIGHKISIGSGNRYVNLFPLNTTGAVYTGQRQASNDKRVFILSRSFYSGEQRNSVTAWSGDINSDWFSFKRQVPAGLNFELSGGPYWTTDIGGFVFTRTDNPQYRELFVRWFEYGTFCPILRVHGTRMPDENELWSYGPDAQKILTSYDRLRYRMLPYIYSLAWMTTNAAYTPMRPLVMDFRTDERAKDIGDEYMYGPAFLVTPITEPGATSRHLYLPQAKFYDFWTGMTPEGGKALDAPAPIDRMPIYVRAGSIVPLGPDMEWSTEKPADPIELRVYPGADGDFTLYEDENDNYNYEKGVHATIPIHWDDAAGKLIIGDRQGEFPGMLKERTFRVAFVGENHGTGIEPTGTADKEVKYSGSEVEVSR